MKTILVFTLFLLSFGVCAQTQQQMNESACEGLSAADDQLNSVYQEILSTYADHTTFIDALRDAQRAWLAFRDAHMVSYYPGTGSYGSVEPMCRCMELRELTEARTAQLRSWLLEREEGEVCGW